MIGHENDVEIVERYTFCLQNSFSKKKLGFKFLAE